MSDHDDRTLYAALFVAWDGADWLAQVLSEDGKVKILWRIRWYDPTPRANHVFDGIDTKRWYESTAADMTVPAAIRAARAFQSQVATAGTAMLGPVLEFDSVIEETGDQERFMNELTSRPWTHVKTFSSKEEADRFDAGLKGN